MRIAVWEIGNRHQFGISPAPEEFSRRLSEALSETEGISLIDDEILIYGRSDTLEKANDDHDRKFVSLLERCRERGIKLNPEKT